MATRKWSLFGGTVEIILYDVDETMAENIFDEIHHEALRLQKIFNFYDPESELSKLNTLRRLKASPELLTVISSSLNYSIMTEGAYDVSKGRKIGAQKKGEVIHILCTYKDIQIKGAQVKLTHPDVWLDLGSIAKGYIVDILIRFIENLGIESTFIDARGDMRIVGPNLEIVEVQHPRKKETFGSILFENKAIATSGDYNQYYGNYDTCHIIGKKDLLSVTVIADTLMEADAFATALFLVGQEQAKHILKAYPKISALLFNKENHITEYNNFDKHYVTDKKP